MAGKLTVTRIKTLTKPGRYGDGNGLWLQVRGPEARSWLLRYKVAGRARAMGLGEWPLISLAAAREAALAARRQLTAGIDPLDAKQAERTAKQQEAAAAQTFRDVAEQYMELHAPTWKNAKHRAQWASTLATYVFPVMGALPVAAIGPDEVMQAVRPLWHEKPETASRVRGRIETVLDYAGAMRWRNGDNPARWRGHLENLLPERSRVRTVKHHAALPWAEAAGFMTALRARDGVAARALEFAILTAARSGEVRGATWGEMDLKAAVRTIPGARMKAGKAHAVPLALAVLAILRELAPTEPDPAALLFPGSAGPLSDMSLAAVLKRMGRADLTCHGFRSTFRDWAAERTGAERDVVEMALAHAVGSKVEAAYRRGDLLAKRTRLMAEWADFCAGRAEPSAAVIPMRRGA